MLIDRIPVIRGLLNKSRLKKSKKALLDAYNLLQGSVMNNPIRSIQFDANGCIYTLEDERSFQFNPEKSAGWLYSVPFTGSFEEKETEYVRRAIQSGWVCIDIGACFGWYSVLFSQLAGTAGQVHAFEPVPDNRDCLTANLKINDISNVKVNPFALGEEETTTKIYVPIDGVSGSLKAHAKLKDCKVIDINISTLDQYVNENGLNRIDFIKADIEGAEFLMLKGAQNALRKYKPTLMLEVQAHSTRLFGYEPESLFEWLKNMGYKAYYVNSNYGLVDCTDSIGKLELPDYNFIFKFD